MVFLLVFFILYIGYFLLINFDSDPSPEICSLKLTISTLKIVWNHESRVKQEILPKKHVVV